MVRGTQDETIPGIVGAVLALGSDVNGVKQIEYADATDRTLSTVPLEDPELETLLPSACGRSNRPGVISRGQFKRLFLADPDKESRRPLLAKDKEKQPRIIVPALNPC